MVVFLVDTRYTNLEKVANIGIGSQVGRSWKNPKQRNRRRRRDGNKPNVFGK
jgi:hypothetical protein